MRKLTTTQNKKLTSSTRIGWTLLGLDSLKARTHWNLHQLVSKKIRSFILERSSRHLLPMLLSLSSTKVLSVFWKLEWKWLRHDKSIGLSERLWHLVRYLRRVSTSGCPDRMLKEEHSPTDIMSCIIRPSTKRPTDHSAISTLIKHPTQFATAPYQNTVFLVIIATYLLSASFKYANVYLKKYS